MNYFLTNVFTLFTFFLLFQPVISLQAEPDSQTQQLNQNLNQQSIKFDDNLQKGTHVQIQQTHSLNFSEIPDQYSIVNTLIYPKNQNQSKDIIVAKLLDQPKKPTISKNISSVLQKQKQSQQKTSQILKKETFEQETIMLQNQQKQKQSSQKKPKSDLFKEKQTKNIQNIEKTDSKILFKQHQIGKPSALTTYPFENDSNIKSYQNGSTPNPHKKEVQASHQNQKSSKPQIQKTKPEPTQPLKQPLLNKPEPTQPLKQPLLNKPEPTQPLKQPLLNKPEPTQPLKQPLPNNDKKPSKRQKKKKQKPSTKASKTSSQNQNKPAELDQKTIEQLNQLINTLKIELVSIKARLSFEEWVKYQLHQNDKNFLIIECIVWFLIVLSIYQVIQNSCKQEKNLQKNKYSLIQTNEIDSEDSDKILNKRDHK